MNKPTVWTVITNKGNSWVRNKPNDDYFSILREVHHRNQLNETPDEYDDILDVDGMTVVTTGLSNIAHRYCEHLRTTTDYVTKNVNIVHTPDWLIAKNTADAKRN